MRTIREEPNFRQKLRQLGVSAERMDGLLEAITLTVATHPEIFEEIPGTRLRRFRVIPFPGIPRMNIWFSFDDHHVNFVEIDALEDSTDFDL